MDRLFKEKNRYMHGMLQQIRSIFLNYPYKIHMVS